MTTPDPLLRPLFLHNALKAQIAHLTEPVAADRDPTPGECPGIPLDVLRAQIVGGTPIYPQWHIGAGPWPSHAQLAERTILQFPRISIPPHPRWMTELDDPPWMRHYRDDDTAPPPDGWTDPTVYTTNCPLPRPQGTRPDSTSTILSLIVLAIIVAWIIASAVLTR